MTASATPTKNDPKALFDPIELTGVLATLYTVTSAGGDRGVRLTTIRLTNVGNVTALVDVHIVPSGGSAGIANRVLSGYPIPAGGLPIFLPLGGEIMEPGATIQAYAYAAKARPSTSMFSATEQASGATTTYAATTVTDASLARTASPANGDDVGKRIYVAGGVFGIITSNTATVLTCSAGWREIVSGLERAAATPANNTTFKISGSLRETSDTALAANSFRQALLQANAKTGRCVGNNAGIATYGTTFQVAEGGWSGGGNPGNTQKWEAIPAVMVTASGIDMTT
jgi:hypothetical protein